MRLRQHLHEYLYVFIPYSCASKLLPGNERMKATRFLLNQGKKKIKPNFCDFNRTFNLEHRTIIAKIGHKLIHSLSLRVNTRGSIELSIQAAAFKRMNTVFRPLPGP